MRNPVIAEAIEHNFSYHAPTKEQVERLTTVRQIAKVFAETINELCPDSREKSSAITKAEEAMMHASAAIERETPKQ